MKRLITRMLSCWAAAVFCGCQSTPRADLVIWGGTIHTMDQRKPTAQAVAARGGRIVFVGSRDGARRLVGPDTRIIDLAGQTMVPGLIESHAHLMGIGNAKKVLDLSDTRSYEELVARVAAAVKQAAPGDWILGRGWHQSRWDPPPQPMVLGFQTHHALSAVSPENPVYLVHASGHAAIANARAMAIAGIPRFGRLGVIAAMQAIHMSSDRPWAIDRLGRQRIEEGAYVWRKLLDSGAIIANGTDAPVEPINPIECFYAAVTRKTLRGEPPGGYEADQRMTRQEAVRSYTLDAAYAAFEEQLKGSIEVGKLADFTVLSQDILSVPEERILQTKAQRTIVGGRVVYEAGG